MATLTATTSPSADHTSSASAPTRMPAERPAPVIRSGAYTAFRARRDEAKFRAWYDAPAA